MCKQNTCNDTSTSYMCIVGRYWSCSAQESITCSQAPLLKFGGHLEEGYALDWSPVTAGRLLSGDCKNCIHLWEPTSGTWSIDPKPFTGHTSSVEDLQWSPTEADVFASCSQDGSIGISMFVWGKNLRFLSRHIMLMLASCMIASGSDDGTFTIRDLRSIKMGDAVVAHFEYHKHPITSIEWSPHEGSTLAVSSADNQLTIWDLACERDEEEAEFRASTKQKVNAPNDIPPQLLFIHQGQKDLKELHWHSQIPRMLISTAADCFNILMPSILETVSADGFNVLPGQHHQNQLSKADPVVPCSLELISSLMEDIKITPSNMAVEYNRPSNDHPG